MLFKNTYNCLHHLLGSVIWLVFATSSLISLLKSRCSLCTAHVVTGANSGIYLTYLQLFMRQSS